MPAGRVKSVKDRGSIPQEAAIFFQLNKGFYIMEYKFCSARLKPLPDMDYTLYTCPKCGVEYESDGRQLVPITEGVMDTYNYVSRKDLTAEKLSQLAS